MVTPKGRMSTEEEGLQFSVHLAVSVLVVAQPSSEVPEGLELPCTC